MDGTLWTIIGIIIIAIVIYFLVKGRGKKTTPSPPSGPPTPPTPPAPGPGPES